MKKLYSIFFLAVSVFICSCTVNEKDPETEALNADTLVVEKNEFGIEDADSLNEFKSEVQKNETISDILNAHNVSYRRIHEIAGEIKDSFDVRKIRPGKKYTIYSETDSVEHVKYFVYQQNPVEYVILNIADSITVKNGEKEVVIREKTVSGIIDYSLYQTLSEQNVTPVLAGSLSEVYAWQIDFFRIQKGDSFTAVYEEKYIDDVFVGIGKILGAKFTHFKNDYFAYGFDDGNGFTYFDEEGNSLRKEFLKTPLKFSRISSRFSYSRLHPILKTRRPHLGIDFAAPSGTPVRAVGDGVIAEAKYKGQAGRLVKIRHNGTYQSAYLHLSRYGKGIKTGTKVRQGQIIGYVGSSGLSTGPHLDFRFWKNGQLVNYLTQKFPPTKPLEKEYFTEFNSAKSVIYGKLGLNNQIAVIEKNNQENKKS
ncbi:MAG: peptidoglycan DD-metalloendopeptidase family protein [Melioribacteraceae bacterium]|nr:peptidoglycan DD-metalloendopeptidase family protein [Melioribacteraceae bacterium]